MNKKIAKKIAKLIECDLSYGSNDKEQETHELGKKVIAQIQPDGNHTEREQSVTMITASEQRYLYRHLKNVYKTKQPREIYDQLVEDLNNLED